MNGSKDSRVAAWVLKRFVSGPHGESLLGDLSEQRERGRPATWYWRQVVSAVLAEIRHEVATQRLGVLVGMVVGFAVLTLLDQMFRGFWQLVLRNATGAAWIGGHWVQLGDAITPVWWLWMAVEGMASGWIISRVPRPNQAAMTVLFAACFVVWQVVQVSLMLALGETPKGFTYSRYLLSSSVVFGGVILGGLFIRANAHAHEVRADIDSPNSDSF